MDFEKIVVRAGEVVELSGIGVIAIGLAGSLVMLVVRTVRSTRQPHADYLAARKAIGRSILLGLELLVAGDIIRTVAVSPTFESVGVLAAVVLIRTFLSFTIELEISGHWPWEQPSTDHNRADTGAGARVASGDVAGPRS